MVLAGKSSIWNITADRKPCSRDRAPGLTARASPDSNAIMHMQSPEPSSPLCKVARRKHASVFQARLPASSIHLPACAPSISGERPLPRSSPVPFPLRHTRTPAGRMSVVPRVVLGTSRNVLVRERAWARVPGAGNVSTARVVRPRGARCADVEYGGTKTSIRTASRAVSVGINPAYLLIGGECRLNHLCRASLTSTQVRTASMML